MPKQSLNITLIQMDIIIGEPEQNFSKLIAKLDETMKAEAKPDLLVIPEMWNTGYALEQIHELADRDGERTKQLLSVFCSNNNVNVLAGSIADKRGEQVYNTIYYFDRNGEVTAEYSKIHLFRLMEEELYLASGDHLGQLQIDGIPAGMMICYDIRFPELSRKLALGGAKVLFVPAEWPHPRLMHWRTLLIARAIENQMYVVSCNRVGTSGTTEFFGHSMIIDPWGEVIAEGDETEQLISSTIDLSLVDQVRTKIPVFEDRRPLLY